MYSFNISLVNIDLTPIMLKTQCSVAIKNKMRSLSPGR